MTTTVASSSSERATLTVEEAARILGIGRASAYNAAKSGDLPTIRIGGRLLVPRARLDALLGKDPQNSDGPAGNRAEREDARSSSHAQAYT